MPVYEAPNDPDEDDDGSSGGSGGYNSPRQSYNFAPGYRGVVYRADVPDWGAGPRSRRNRQAPTDVNDVPPSSSETNAEEHNEGSDEQQTSTNSEDVHYKLQTMKWGLIPFWTKRNPGYGSVMKTINCRDDSLAQSGGMWASMKGRKRCIVVAQGFYEWLKKDGGREKMPHYVRRKDGKLMCFAGLWDVVQYESMYTDSVMFPNAYEQTRLEAN
jgi:putative SOS response-associated peptidase YedK